METLQIVVDDHQPDPRVTLRGVIDSTTVGQLFTLIGQTFKRGGSITLDLREVANIDSSGVACLAYGLKMLGRSGMIFAGMSAVVERSLKTAGWDYQAHPRLVHEEVEGLTEAMGSEVNDLRHSIYTMAHLVSEIFYHGVIRPLRGVPTSMALFVEHLARIGAGSAPIVLLVALLVGLTTAFQAVYQLRQFGANIYIADLVGISMMRELGPLMAAILVAGRCGAAITAEIGTMVVNEEIDAMRMFGINPIAYLAVPRFYATTISQALLGVMSGITGIISGYLIALTFLGINTAAYINQTLQAISIGDVIFNLSKSMTFGATIVVIAVYYGLQVTGGAAGVGKATTNSVVTAIFAIIIWDCVFSFI